VNTEAIVYIARKLGWSRREIGDLTPQQFVDILKELSYQESLEDYRTQHNVASILAAIYNTIPRKKGSKTFKASDFIGESPQRNATPKENSIELLAKRRGIKLPSK